VMRTPLDATSIPLVGTQVIEASAGTGKTYTITSLLVRLVTEGLLGIEQVLCVTFTNAAAAELEGRIRERLTQVRRAVSSGESGGDEVAAHLLRSDREEALRRLERAVHDVDRARVTTIHGFCARALAEYALSSAARPDTTLLADDRGVLYDVVTDFWSSQVATLGVSEFRSMRGQTLHGDLAKVARGVVSAPGVPLDAPPELVEGEGEGALTAYSQDFPSAREAFFEQGRSLFEALTTDRGLDRNKYRVPTIERAFSALSSYFQAGELDPRSYPDLEDGRFTKERVHAAVKRQGVPLNHPLLDLLARHRARCEDVVRAADRKRDVLLHRLATEIEARLVAEHDRLGTQSFDGLLRALDQGLGQEGSGAKLAAAIRRRYPALLIDEFQDTDPIQYRVFRRIYPPAEASQGGACGLFFIGDPKQSIYRFRGADVSTYLAATGSAAPVWTLGTSFRSSPRLVAAQNALLGLHGRPFAESAIRFEPVRAAPARKNLLLLADGQPAPGLRIVRTSGGDEVELAADEVVRLLTSGLLLDGRSVSPRDLAVLTRTNAQAEAVQAALRLVRVPAIMHGDRSVFEASEAKELRRVLCAWLEPGRRSLVHAALATRLVGRTASELERLGTDAEAFEQEMERLRRYATAWRQRGIAVALETLFAEENLLPRTLADLDGERRMTNFRHLLELLHQAEVERHLGVVGLLRFLELAIYSPTGHEMAAEARQVRLESDDDAVTLTTVHKSKGLEYGIVLLPQIGRVERKPGRQPPVARYHDPERGGREVLHVGDDDDTPHALASKEERQEALRLGYVGLTRAKHQVIALIGEDRGFSALSWFLHGGGAGVDVTGSDGWKNLSDEVIEQNYQELLERAEGTIEVAQPETEVPRTAALELRVASRVELAPPTPVKAPLTLQRTSSFSAMTRTKAPLSRAEREGKDVDRTEAGPHLLVEPPGAEPIALNDFPRGAGPGDALHAILERMPFARPAPGETASPEARLRLIESELSRRGFDAAFAPVLDRCLGAALEVPLSPSGARLGQLGPRDCARELEFSLPVRQKSSGAELLSARAIQRELAARAEPSFLSPEYVRAVGQLDFPAFEGFLRGFLDLVFFEQGKIFVLDYKSNHLGGRYADYTRAHLQAAMESHHYLLQGLLYAVATHQYAKTRIQGYRYEEHFGGVSYLFLRGVAPDEPTGETGVYFFRPGAELIEGLSRLLSGEAAL